MITGKFADAIDELDAAITARKFHGYLPLTIPHELDAIPEAFVRSYQMAELPDKELISLLREDASSVLLALAERQAAFAVRTRSVERLKLSVLALGLAATISPDPRKGMLSMPLAWRTAQLLQLKPSEVFLVLADELPQIGRDALTAFANRNPEDQTLACMGYVESEDADGFRYARTW